MSVFWFELADDVEVGRSGRFSWKLERPAFLDGGWGVCLERVWAEGCPVEDRSVSVMIVEWQGPWRGLCVSRRRHLECNEDTTFLNRKWRGTRSKAINPTTCPIPGKRTPFFRHLYLLPT